MLKKQAFTLIELLVVIAIIGLLAAIIAPITRNALDHAQSTKCLSNLRQNYSSMLQYASDHGGRFMVSGGHTPTQNSPTPWTRILVEGGYLDSATNPVVRCPSEAPYGRNASADDAYSIGGGIAGRIEFRAAAPEVTPREGYDVPFPDRDRPMVHWRYQHHNTNMAFNDTYYHFLTIANPSKYLSFVDTWREGSGTGSNTLRQSHRAGAGRSSSGSGNAIGVWNAGIAMRHGRPGREVANAANWDGSARGYTATELADRMWNQAFVGRKGKYEIIQLR